MTYKQTKKGFLWWKKWHYELLNTPMILEFKSPQQLDKRDLDILFDKVLQLSAVRGEIKTEKGTVYFECNNFNWLPDEEENEKET